MTTLLREPIKVMGAGRTDAGVHAVKMFAHFEMETPFDHDTLIFKINWFLPSDIAVHRVFEVTPKAHARFNALSRTYHYRISNTKNVFTHDFAYKIFIPLDVEKMNAACTILLRYKDFQCFSKSNTDVKTYFCDIKEAYWILNDTELTFVITADRFLRNMVRAIVGTMVNIGIGKLRLEQLHDIINSKDRSEAGFSVPPQGLYLMDIKYPDTIYNVNQ